MRELLEIDNIVFSTGVNSRRVWAKGVLQEGGVLNIRGPSGSGKTTLLRIIARLRESEKGRVIFQGQPWQEFSSLLWRRAVHYLAQKPVVFDGTVLANLQRPFELATVKKEIQFDLALANNLLDRLQLARELTGQDARTLSGGELSRLALVRALLVQPKVLLLDEPLAALDGEAAAAVLDLIGEWAGKEPGRGVVLVSHVGEISGLPGLTVTDLGIKAGDSTE